MPDLLYFQVNFLNFQPRHDSQSCLRIRMQQDSHPEIVFHKLCLEIQQGSSMQQRVQLIRNLDRPVALPTEGALYLMQSSTS